jgi:glycosyltransferase involved in cell wall biosynthesis
MQERKLHIVCHDVPYPPDYGGVFDLYYKIRTLYEEGIKIHLHCFTNGRSEQPILNTFCEQVYYYPRRTGHKGFSRHLPYIVCSRSNPELLERLLQDEYPILLEGVHCSYLMQDNRFGTRKILLRLHNVESVYYKQLANCSTSWFKKLYYLRESAILKKYERNIASSWPLLAVSQSDANMAAGCYQSKNITVIPVFLPFQHIESPQGTGCYCLYHGNLSVDENEKAVIWLLENVFNDLPIPFLVAGKNPGPKIYRAVARLKNCCIVPDPSDAELKDIISKAQLHVIPSFNCTGVKLKLLNALFNGRHCVVNASAVEGTGLREVCHLADGAKEFKVLIENLYERPFTFLDLQLRREKLLGQFDNHHTARSLIAQIW